MIDTEKEMLFFVTDKKYIRFFSENLGINDLSFMCDLDIYWHDGNKNMLIGLVFSCMFGESFEEKLNKAIVKKNLFNDIDNISPGVFFNIYATPEVFKDRPWKMQCDGIKYQLCSAEIESENFSLTTFLYNDHNENIIFEVSPKFNWIKDDNFTEKELIEEESRFLKFIVDYKPIVKEIIPLKVAKKWLAQIKRLNKIILYNETDGCECGKTLFKDGES